MQNMQDHAERPLKLSEAIRLGAMLTAQSRMYLSDGKGSTCALGAAALAVSIPVEDTEATYSALRARWPILLREVVGPTGFDDELLRVVYSLNDVKGWTRERIADWVEQVEMEQDREQEQHQAQVDLSEEELWHAQ